MNSLAYNYATFGARMEITEFKYCANFCEENIWHLCQNPELEGFSKKVLFVSNSNRNCPFRYQKSINGDEVVWWNYHVILLASSKHTNYIYDFDSILSVPLRGKEYLQKSFHRHENWKETDLPCFKVIDSGDYLNSFISDRSHMKDDEGNWLSTPPNWPKIGKVGGLPLDSLLNFTVSSGQKIYNLDEMMAKVEEISVGPN